MQNPIISTLLLASLASLIGCTGSEPVNGFLSLDLKPALILRPGQTNINDTYYYVETHIGHPGQRFRAFFDFDYYESIVGITNSMNVVGLYNPNMSIRSNRISYSDTFIHQTFNGKNLIRASGYQDQLILTSYGQPIQMQFNFKAIDETEFSLAVENKYDVIIGLNNMVHHENSYREFLNVSMSTGLITARQYSVGFNGKKQPGKLFIGGINRSSYEGEINLHKSRGIYQFQLKLDYVTLGSRVLETRSSIGFNISQSDLLGPRVKVDEIYTLLGATVVNGLPKLPENTKIDQLPTLTFVINDVSYKYPPQLYVNQDRQIMYLGIRPNSLDSEHSWIFGTDFMSVFYTAFDVDTKTVGIAPMSH